MGIQAVGQIGASTVVETDSGQMAEIRANGTVGAHTDTAHFMRNLGGYIEAVTDPEAASKAVAAAEKLLPKTHGR